LTAAAADSTARPSKDGVDVTTRVAVLTMKAQLRGRIRREVVTLLERGYQVLVVGLESKGDFLQGLEHPNLEVRLLKPESVYTKGVGRSRVLLAFLTPRSRRRQGVG
jgi:hypothetical protein